jgi:hypothetical protein
VNPQAFPWLLGSCPSGRSPEWPQQYRISSFHLHLEHLALQVLYRQLHFKISLN